MLVHDLGEPAEGACVSVRPSPVAFCLCVPAGGDGAADSGGGESGVIQPPGAEGRTGSQGLFSPCGDEQQRDDPALYFGKGLTGKEAARGQE